MEAIILAGGFGTRLQKVVNDIPKSMALINNRPFLEYQINYLKKYNINRIILSVGYKKNIISDYFKDNFNGIEIVYAVEDKPLGTGGGIKNALKFLKSDFAFILNGDSLFNVNLTDFYNFHKNNKSKISIALRCLDDVGRFGSVEINNNNEIINFAEKKDRKGKGYINGGIYLFDKKYFLNLDMPEKFSIEKDFFEKIIKKEKVFGFLSDDYFLDIGIPDDFIKAQDDFKKFEY